MASFEYIERTPPPEPEEYILKLTHNETVLLLHALSAYAYPNRVSKPFVYGYKKEYDAVNNALREM